MITTLSAIRALGEHRDRARTRRAVLGRPHSQPRAKAARRKLIDIPQVVAAISLLFGIMIIVLVGRASPGPAMYLDPSGSSGWGGSPTQAFID